MEHDDGDDPLSHLALHPRRHARGRIARGFFDVWRTVAVKALSKT